MPNRILKDSICTSPTIDDLTEQEENFFYRLMVHCDDYGLMDARESVLRARLYPLRLNRISDACIRNLLFRCVEVGLVEVYESKGRPYLHLVTWDAHQQVRAKRPKYPKPAEGQPITLIKESLQSSDINGNQLITLAPVIQSNPIQSESNPIQSESEISHEISGTLPRGPVLTFAQFSEKLRGAPPNKSAATLAEAVEMVYAVECKEYGRLAKMVNQHHAGVLLDIIFSCVTKWNGIDNPLDYIQATAIAKKNGRNGNGHSAEKLPPNHHEIEPPDMRHAEPVHNEPLNGVAADLEEAESAEDRALVREHEYRLRLDTHYRVWWDESEPYLMMGRDAPRPKPSWPTYLPRLGELVESKVG